MIQISDIIAIQIAKNISGIMIVEYVIKTADLAMDMMNTNVYHAMIRIMIFILLEQDVWKNVEMVSRWAIMNVMMEI